MGLSRLSSKCRTCPFVETCEHKQMEALAYLNSEANIKQESLTPATNLNQIDPSKYYAGTELEGLDTFSRQLRRFDLGRKFKNEL